MDFNIIIVMGLLMVANGNPPEKRFHTHMQQQQFHPVSILNNILKPLEFQNHEFSTNSATGSATHLEHHVSSSNSQATSSSFKGIHKVIYNEPGPKKILDIECNPSSNLTVKQTSDPVQSDFSSSKLTNNMNLESNSSFENHTLLESSSTINQVSNTIVNDLTSDEHRANDFDFVAQEEIDPVQSDFSANKLSGNSNKTTTVVTVTPSEGITFLNNSGSNNINVGEITNVETTTVFNGLVVEEKLDVVNKENSTSELHSYGEFEMILENSSNKSSNHDGIVTEVADTTVNISEDGKVSSTEATGLGSFTSNNSTNQDEMVTEVADITLNLTEDGKEFSTEATDLGSYALGQAPVVVESDNSSNEEGETDVSVNGEMYVDGQEPIEIVTAFTPFEVSSTSANADDHVTIVWASNFTDTEDYDVKNPFMGEHISDGIGTETDANSQSEHDKPLVSSTEEPITIVTAISPTQFQNYSAGGELTGQNVGSIKFASGMIAGIQNEEKNYGDGVSAHNQHINTINVSNHSTIILENKETHFVEAPMVNSSSSGALQFMQDHNSSDILNHMIHQFHMGNSHAQEHHQNIGSHGNKPIITTGNMHMGGTASSHSSTADHNVVSKPEKTKFPSGAVTVQNPTMNMGFNNHMDNQYFNRPMGNQMFTSFFGGTSNQHNQPTSDFLNFMPNQFSMNIGNRPAEQQQHMHQMSGNEQNSQTSGHQINNQLNHYGNKHMGMHSTGFNNQMQNNFFNQHMGGQSFGGNQQTQSNLNYFQHGSTMNMGNKPMNSGNQQHTVMVENLAGGHIKNQMQNQQNNIMQNYLNRPMGAQTSPSFFNGLVNQQQPMLEFFNHIIDHTAIPNLPQGQQSENVHISGSEQINQQAINKPVGSETMMENSGTTGTSIMTSSLVVQNPVTVLNTTNSTKIHHQESLTEGSGSSSSTHGQKPASGEESSVFGALEQIAATSHTDGPLTITKPIGNSSSEQTSSMISSHATSTTEIFNPVQNHFVNNPMGGQMFPPLFNAFVNQQQTSSGSFNNVMVNRPASQSGQISVSSSSGNGQDNNNSGNIESLDHKPAVEILNRPLGSQMFPQFLAGFNNQQQQSNFGNQPVFVGSSIQSSSFSDGNKTQTVVTSTDSLTGKITKTKYETVGGKPVTVFQTISSSVNGDKAETVITANNPITGEISQTKYESVKNLPEEFNDSLDSSVVASDMSSLNYSTIDNQTQIGMSNNSHVDEAEIEEKVPQFVGDQQEHISVDMGNNSEGPNIQSGSSSIEEKTQTVEVAQIKDEFEEKRATSLETVSSSVDGEKADTLIAIGKPIANESEFATQTSGYSSNSSVVETLVSGGSIVTQTHGVNDTVTENIGISNKPHREESKLEATSIESEGEKTQTVLTSADILTGKVTQTKFESSEGKQIISSSVDGEKSTTVISFNHPVTSMHESSSVKNLPQQLDDSSTNFTAEALASLITHGMNDTKMDQIVISGESHQDNSKIEETVLQIAGGFNNNQQHNDQMGVNMGTNHEEQIVGTSLDQPVVISTNSLTGNETQTKYESSEGNSTTVFETISSTLNGEQAATLIISNNPIMSEVSQSEYESTSIENLPQPSAYSSNSSIVETELTNSSNSTDDDLMLNHGVYGSIDKEINDSTQYDSTLDLGDGSIDNEQHDTSENFNHHDVLGDNVGDKSLEGSNIQSNSSSQTSAEVLIEKVTQTQHESSEGTQEAVFETISSSIDGDKVETLITSNDTIAGEVSQTKYDSSSFKNLSQEFVDASDIPNTNYTITNGLTQIIGINNAETETIVHLNENESKSEEKDSQFVNNQQHYTSEDFNHRDQLENKPADGSSNEENTQTVITSTEILTGNVIQIKQESSGEKSATSFGTISNSGDGKKDETINVFNNRTSETIEASSVENHSEEFNGITNSSITKILSLVSEVGPADGGNNSETKTVITNQDESKMEETVPEFIGGFNNNQQQHKLEVNAHNDLLSVINENKPVGSSIQFNSLPNGEKTQTASSTGEVSETQYGSSGGKPVFQTIFTSVDGKKTLIMSNKPILGEFPHTKYESPQIKQRPHGFDDSSSVTKKIIISNSKIEENTQTKLNSKNNSAEFIKAIMNNSIKGTVGANIPNMVAETPLVAVLSSQNSSLGSSNRIKYILYPSNLINKSPDLPSQNGMASPFPKSPAMNEILWRKRKYSIINFAKEEKDDSLCNGGIFKPVGTSTNSQTGKVTLFKLKFAGVNKANVPVKTRLSSE